MCELGCGEHVSSQRGELGAVAGFFAGDERVAVVPVFEEVVEEKSWGVGVAVGGFFDGPTNAGAEGEKGHWVASIEWVGVHEGEGAEDVGEVAPGFVEDALLHWGEIVAAVCWERIFVDRDDRAVFAKEEPCPDTVAVWQVVVIEGITIRCGAGVLCAVE